MNFSKKEESVMKDVDFLLTKFMILEKVKELFGHIRDRLKETSRELSFATSGQPHDKISRVKITGNFPTWY
ncbi:MAG: hypothetical protein IPL46_15225 [Saprospiraceae bacterium]|nr:hypothetical protein [Saprospiraceae bacterium]